MSNRLKKVALSSLSGAALLVALVSNANASLVTIGLGIDAPAVAVVSGTNTATYSLGGTIIGASSAPLLPTDLLDSTSLNLNATGVHTINVAVTAQGLTAPFAPLGITPFLSAFTSNTLPAGWTITESTLIDSLDGLFSGSLLSSHNFTAIGTSVQTALGNAGAGPYSMTELYTIQTTGAGSSLSTINISAVPEASTWAMMVLGFIGVGFMAYRRKAKPALMAA
jgi:hypothetical protein